MREWSAGSLVLRAMGWFVGSGMTVRAGGVRIWVLVREWSAGRLVMRAMGCFGGAGIPVLAGWVRIWWLVREWSAGRLVMRARGCLAGVVLMAGWDGVPTGKGFYEDYCGCGLWWTFGRT